MAVTGQNHQQILRNSEKRLIQQSYVGRVASSLFLSENKALYPPFEHSENNIIIETFNESKRAALEAIRALRDFGTKDVVNNNTKLTERNNIILDVNRKSTAIRRFEEITVLARPLLDTIKSHGALASMGKETLAIRMQLNKRVAQVTNSRSQVLIVASEILRIFGDSWRTSGTILRNYAISTFAEKLLVETNYFNLMYCVGASGDSGCFTSTFCLSHSKAIARGFK